MEYTENYGFDKPEGTDFVDVEHFNTNTELIDKLLCPEYAGEKTLTELTTGEKLSTGFGKLAKAVKDLISHLKDNTIHITSKERELWNTVTDRAKTDGSNATGEWPIDIIGNATTATADSAGNNILNTYARKDRVVENNNAKKVMQLSSAGWYRIAKVAASSLNNASGAVARSCDLIFKRTYNTANNEYHEVKYLEVYGSRKFINVIDKSNTRLISKIRAVKDADYTTYLEIYYTGTTANTLTILLNNASYQFGAWELISPQATEETVDGVTVLATNTIYANSKSVNYIKLAESNDYCERVIGLIKLNSNTYSEQRSNGSIDIIRDNGVLAPLKIIYSMEKVYNSTTSFSCDYISIGKFEKLKPVIFTYNEELYAGFYYYRGNQKSENVLFEVSGSISPLLIEVYNTNTGTILNEEIYNSLVFDSYKSTGVYTNGNIYENGIKLSDAYATKEELTAIDTELTGMFNSIKSFNTNDFSGKILNKNTYVSAVTTAKSVISRLALDYYSLMLCQCFFKLTSAGPTTTEATFQVTVADFLGYSGYRLPTDYKLDHTLYSPNGWVRITNEVNGTLYNNMLLVSFQAGRATAFDVNGILPLPVVEVH